MKKEQLTMFDLEAAFKALDEIDMPKAEKGIRANKEDLKESFKDYRRSRTDLLMEDYYDISDAADLEEAKAEREAEVAKAKLARIEKIVDLEAESEEDLLPSYVGKMIIQCPQCMTLFYKEEADVVKSETDEETVNEAEVCQHCGNDTGYTLIGKVEGVTEEEVMSEEQPEDEVPAEEETVDFESAEETEDMPAEEETSAEDFDLAPVEEEEESSTEEVVEESLQLNEAAAKEILYKKGVFIAGDEGEHFTGYYNPDYTWNGWFAPGFEKADCDKIADSYNKAMGKELMYYDEELDAYINLPEDGKEDKYVHERTECETVDGKKQLYFVGDGWTWDLLEESLTEAVDKDLQAKLDAHNEYIKFLQEEIEKEEKALEAAKNDFIKEAIQRRLEALKADLDAALPEEVKNTVEAEAEAPVEFEAPSEIEPAEEATGPSEVEAEAEEDGVAEDKEVIEEEVKESLKESLIEEKEEIKELSEDEFDELIDYLADNEGAVLKQEDLLDVEEIDESIFNDHINKYLTEVYSNVKSFETTKCSYDDQKLVIEGFINFNSGNTKNTKFIFENKENKLMGSNTDLTEEIAFTLNYNIVDSKLITESINYRYTINNILVEGLTK